MICTTQNHTHTDVYYTAFIFHVPNFWVYILPFFSPWKIFLYAGWEGLTWPVLWAWRHWWCKPSTRAKAVARWRSEARTAEEQPAGDTAGFARLPAGGFCRQPPVSTLNVGGRLAAGRQEPHLPTNPIKLRPETPSAASGPPAKKPTWIHTSLSSPKIPGSQIQLVMRGVGGRGCFVATVLLTVCVNLLHYPLNPHLPSEQKFTTSVFSINLATGSQLLICKCSPRFLDAIVRLDELVGHW